MNTLMQCMRCKHYWWSNANDKCAKCDTEAKTKLTEEDKELLNLLANTEENDG